MLRLCFAMIAQIKAIDYTDKTKYIFHSCIRGIMYLPNTSHLAGALAAF